MQLHFGTMGKSPKKTSPSPQPPQAKKQASSSYFSSFCKFDNCSEGKVGSQPGITGCVSPTVSCQEPSTKQGWDQQPTILGHQLCAYQGERIPSAATSTAKEAENGSLSTSPPPPSGGIAQGTKSPSAHCNSYSQSCVSITYRRKGVCAWCHH